MSSDSIDKLRKEFHEEVRRLEELSNKSETSIKNYVGEQNANLMNEILKVINSMNSKNQIDDPYKKLTEWSQEAMNQIKKDVSDSIQEDDPKKAKKSQKSSDDMDKLLNKVIGIIEDVKKNDMTVQNDNPFYPPKKIFSFSRNKRGARNSLSLLMAGTGLLILSSGVWDAAGDLLSVQGRLIIGIMIVAMTAWLERKKVFALFGQE